MTERNRSITCPHFRPTANSHRCADYISNGSCRRPDEGMCVEWLKLKHGIEVPSRTAESKRLDPDAPVPSAAPPTPTNRDLFGNPIELPAPKPRLAPSASTSVAAPRQPKPLPIVTPQGTAPVRAVNEADVTSLKACGIEACIDNDKLGPVWIVPEYTDESRHELKIEHAMVIAVVASVFPDARVTALRRPSNRPDEKST
ncbi:MAG TPA: hypothetical protein VKP30_25030 [Polyangiaceae bacterium]|nr:hypothetical protein [Polyangiaceae bacterium]